MLREVENETGARSARSSTPSPWRPAFEDSTVAPTQLWSSYCAHRCPLRPCCPRTHPAQPLRRIPPSPHFSQGPRPPQSPTARAPWLVEPQWCVPIVTAARGSRRQILALSASAVERGFVSHQDSKWGECPQCRKEVRAGLCYARWRPSCIQAPPHFICAGASESIGELEDHVPHLYREPRYHRGVGMGGAP